MGAATAKRNASMKVIREQIAEQSSEDVVQYPIQKEPGVFHSVYGKQLNEVLKVWGEMNDDRPLWIYQANSLWWQAHWVTSSGSKILRHSWIVHVNLNQESKDLWYRTMANESSPDAQEFMDLADDGEWGQCCFWWMRRFVISELSVIKPKSNCLEFAPMVKIVHDGTIEESFVDLEDFGFTPSYDLRGVEINPAIALEKKIFSQIIRRDIIK